MTDRYPYRHHGPAVHGSKLADYLISEANMIEDIEQLRAENARLRELLSIAVEMTGEPECWYDHHGYCQAHNLEPKGECWVELSSAILSADPAPVAGGVQAIAQERQRQINIENWSASHDDAHDSGEMAGAAACYAMQAALDGISRKDLMDTIKHAIRELWPWNLHWWKPKNARADLVRAGALIAAEIDRLDRLDRAIAGENGNENG